jgi:hypothetical protein
VTFIAIIGAAFAIGFAIPDFLVRVAQDLFRQAAGR